MAEEYRALAGWFVVDEVDSARAPAIASLGYRVLITDTVMPDDQAARRLAAAILRFWRNGGG